MQINPLLTNKINSVREKRGLVNALGSIIRSITGNLDAEDAAKYDKILNEITTNQNKMKTVIKNQISILESSIEKFNQSIYLLSHNQEIIRDKIFQIEQHIKNVVIENSKISHLFQIETIISQLITEYQMITQILNTLETAITFAKLGILHNSIVDPDDLLKEINYIQPYLRNSHKLPFQPTRENLLLFEQITNVKAYQKLNKLIFIIEIPITQKEDYNYFQLFPLPISKGDHFEAIIPNAKYLILNEHKYISTNTPCKKITGNQFLCEEQNPYSLEKNKPCEVRLLKYDTNNINCKTIPVSLTGPKVQKLSKNKFLVIIPNKIVSYQICGKEKDNIPLYGQYVINIPLQCKINIEHFSLSVYEESREIIKQIELPEIITNISESEKSSVKIKPLILDTIHLDDLKTLNTALSIQRTNIDSLNEPIIHQNFSIWTIILYLILFGAIGFLFIKALAKYWKGRIIPGEADHGENPESSSEERTFYV